MRNIVLLLVPFCLTTFTYFGCQPIKVAERQARKDAKWYQRAIESSMVPEVSKIDNNLVAINKQNPNLIWKEIEGDEYLLVVSWKNTVSYYEPYIDSGFYNTSHYPIWISTAPELLQRMKGTKPEKVDHRLKQLLGLPPTSEYNYFVEFWVRPQDLFRPCPDAEISDGTCDTHFPANTDSSHIDWINENRISRYYQPTLYEKYPWTQLGYTYDWSPKNKSHVGLSEFVIGTNKNIVVKAIYTTEAYLGKGEN